MAKKPVETAARFIPEDPTLETLHQAAQACTACPLYAGATQVVLGEGGLGALMLVGEQPGNEEDLEGHPFVGPAGRLLDKALGEAGLDPGQVFKTNAVKHFKYEQRGKRRIHQRPTRYKMEVCKPWLKAEILLATPRCIVPLGATAAVSVLGKAVSITSQRGQFLESQWSAPVLVTYHPSAALRAPEAEQRQEIYRMLLDDLRLAATKLG